MPSLSELETWLSTSQVSKELGYSRQGAINLAEARKIRAVKTAAGWLYDPASVALFSAQRATDVHKDMMRATDPKQIMRDTDPRRIEKEIREMEAHIKRASKR